MDTLAEITLSPVNRSGNPRQLLLQSLECGASLQFSLFTGSPYALKNTRYHTLFGSSAADWTQTIGEYDQILREVYAQLGEGSIRRHEQLSDGVFQTLWDNGKRLVVNYNDSPYSLEGNSVSAMGWLVL